MSPDRPTRGISNRTRAWLWVGLWALLILGLGGDELSFDHTSRFLGPLIRWLLPGISEANSEWLHFSIRKIAHLAEYGLLGLLILRALTVDGSGALPRSALIALLLATAFAATDETRQSLSATRMGSVWDVILDSLGAGVGIAFLPWARTHLPGFDRRSGQSKRGAVAATEGTHGGGAE